MLRSLITDRWNAYLWAGNEMESPELLVGLWRRLPSSLFSNRPLKENRLDSAFCSERFCFFITRNDFLRHFKWQFVLNVVGEWSKYISCAWLFLCNISNVMFFFTNNWHIKAFDIEARQELCWHFWVRQRSLMFEASAFALELAVINWRHGSGNRSFVIYFWMCKCLSRAGTWLMSLMIWLTSFVLGMNILTFQAKSYHTNFRLNRLRNLSLRYRRGHARCSFRHRKPRTHLDTTARRWWEAASPCAPCSLTCSSSQHLSNHTFAFRCRKTNRLGNGLLEDPKTV